MENFPKDPGSPGCHFYSNKNPVSLGGLEMNKSRRSALRHHVAKNFASLLPFVCLIQLALSANVFAQSELIAGQNINMVSGKQWPGGDPFLNKQNEGTIGVSARNDCHLMGGSNDYRSVDLPGLPDGKTVGDSWVSTYVSTDCAGSWFSTLMPGYPQDSSPLGLASPLKLALGGQGYEASADPVVRSGASGLFHYSGIAFTRAFEPPSAGFVSTYIDLNNTELGNPFGFVGTVLFDHNDDGISFIDKPWTAVDKPRGGVTRFIDVHTDDDGIPDLTNVSVECGNVYTAYARIEGDGSAAIRSQIMFTRSEDCAQTFSDPIQLSLPNTINQGAAVAIEPLSGRIQVAWRQFENATLNCTRKASFWRTTPAAWPVDQLELAGIIVRKGDGSHVVVELADADDDLDTEAFDEFDFSDDADRPSGVLRQLLAAWLNSLAGAGVSAVTDELAEAEAWLVENPLGTHPKGDIKRRGNDLRKILRDYNKGKLGPGNCADMMGSATNGLLSGLNPNAIMVVSSTDFGETFSEPVAATGPHYHPFEQGTTEFSFRTLGFPTMVFDHQGRSYIAVSSRGFASADPDPVGGDARIAVTTSMNGTTWTPLQAIDDEPGVPNHQIMPAFDFQREKLFLLYYDFRQDSLALFDRFIVDVPLDESTVLRHTTDVRAAIADPADNPVFTDYSILDGASTQASRYPFLILDNAGTTYRQQLKINSPGLPVAKDGSVPFFSDYVDLGSQDFYYDDATSSWEFDIFAGRGVPVVHAVWTDNRDVVPPLDNNWQSYVPPTYVVDGELPSEEPRESIFDPTQTVATCTPGTIDIDRTRMRNQNIYTSRLTQGLVASVPGNNRALGTIQRAFVGFVQNTTSETKLFRLTILNQPVGGSASFDQFAPEVERIEVVNSNSSIARTVFVTSTPSDPSASIDIRVQEIIELSEGVYMDGDLAAVMTINPDPTAPVSDDGGLLAEEIYTPAIFNPAIFNPAIFNASLLGTDEVGIYNPAIFNPAIFNATDQVTASLIQLALFNPAIFNPAIFNPAIFNPAIFNPAIFNPAIFNPAIFNPAIFNPAIFNPAIFNPAIFNPAIFNPAIFNNSMVETSVVVTNTGNATAAYSLNLDLEDPPEGFLFQVMVYRTYLVPSADGCTLTEQVVQEQLVTDMLPNLNGNLSSPDSTSFYVEPGDYVVVSVRIVPDPNAPVQGNPEDINALNTLNLSQSVVPQAVDTAGIVAGEMEPTPVVILAPSVSASGIVDQQQPIIDSSIGGFTIGGASSTQIAQIVTTGLAGFLTEVRLPVACSVDDLIVEIQGVTGSGFPNGTVLATETVDGAELPTFFPSPPSFRAISFTSPSLFVVGEPFAIVLRSLGDCTIFQGPVGDPYAGGDGAYFDLPFPGWNPFLTVTRKDIPFQTVVVSKEPARIAFGSNRDGNFKIFVMDADGSNQTPLTTNTGDEFWPDWSPDGRKIAFYSLIGGGNSEIYVVDSDGSNLTKLTNNPFRDETPVWSPDGNKIAFSTNRDGDWEVYVMDADGSNQTNLTMTLGVDVRPTWSPNGRKIAFDSNRDGNREIYVMDADGSNQTNLTNSSTQDFAAAWSPIGGKIAFNSERDGNREIYVMDRDGSNQTRLTANAGTDRWPDWSADGRKIAFDSDRDGNREIYVMDADGSNQTRLTINTDSDLDPKWSPGRL